MSPNSLPFISDFHADIVKTPSDIKFGEVLGSLEFVNELRDEGQGVLVFHRDVVESPIVLYESESAVFLFNEEDRRCHRRFGRSDASCL